MWLSCTGYERDHGENDLANVRLETSVFKEGHNGSLRIDWTKFDVRLNGNYNFALWLSKSDVANLFVASFKDQPLSEILKLLGRAERNEPSPEHDEI